MERDFDTFDPSEALVDEGRNLYYPADWQKGDPVFVLNEPDLDAYCPDCGDDLSLVMNHICGLERRKGLDCE